MEHCADTSRDEETEVMKEERKDLFKRLESQENDLLLAAELGAALLDKNEEISKQGEAMVVDYLQQLEDLEQEKYELRRRLEVLEEEYQQQVTELQTDMRLVKRALEKQERRRKSFDSQSSETVRQMTEENQKLTLEVKKAREKEKELVEHKLSVNSQVAERQTNLKEHFSNIDDLNKKIHDIQVVNEALDLKKESLIKEIGSMTKAVEHSANKIKQMERKTKQQDNVHSDCETECDKLRTSKEGLLAKFEELSNNSDNSKNILLEMTSVAQPDTLSHETTMGKQKSKEFQTVRQINGENTELVNLKNEVLSVYQQARNMFTNLNRARRQREVTQSMQTSCGSSGSSEFTLGQQVRVNQLCSLLVELEEMLLMAETNNCEGGTCRNIVIDLEVELHRTKEAIEHAEMRLKQVELESKQETDRLQEIKCKLSLVDKSLLAAEEQKEIYKADLERLGVSKEVMIKSAWDTRDEAVEAKNAAEVDLAKNRIEKMQVNSQLLEAVQQKVVLSQRLEHMEEDMDTFIQKQLSTRLAMRESDTSSEGEMEKETLARRISKTIFRH